MSPFHCEFNINQSQYEQLALIIYHNSRYFIALSETNVLLNTSIQVQLPPQPYLCSTDRLVTSIVKENINGCFFSIFANFLYMYIGYLSRLEQDCGFDKMIAASKFYWKLPNNHKLLKSFYIKKGPWLNLFSFIETRPYYFASIRESKFDFFGIRIISHNSFLSPVVRLTIN